MASEVPRAQSSGKSSELSKLLTQEMNFLESTKTLGPTLRKVYNMLMTIKPTSCESERAFSSSAYLITKIRSRLSDRTIDTLCFLRALCRNKNAFGP